MCRIEETIYLRMDGHRPVLQDTVYCDRGLRSGKRCSDAKVHTTEYHDPTSSPIPSSPHTPRGSPYQTRSRQPSTISRRPSTRDGTVTLKPELIIEIGSKKGKGKGYPTISIHAKDNHRSSMGSSSAIDSPGSDASYTVRTGYPDASLPSLNSSRLRTGGFSPGHHRSPSSDESYTGSSRVPSLYRNSDDYDTPSLTTTASSGTRPIIHNVQRHVPSPVNTTLGQSGSPPGSYRTTVVTPNGVYDETSYHAGHNNRLRASYTDSEAIEITGRGEDRERRRLEARRNQEASDREVAAALIREENRKVHFKSPHAKDREEQRANKTYANRAEGRERLRQQQRKEREAQSTREAASKKPKPQANSSKPSAPSRRGSTRMTSTEFAEQQQLLHAELIQMQDERAKTEANEWEEKTQQQQPTLLQRQQNPEYYNPRGGDYPLLNGQGSMFRGNSLTGSGKQSSMTRSGSTRDSSTNQPRQERHQPPASFYNNSANTGIRGDLSQSRVRRPSSSHQERPFNPFAQPAPITRTDDPWDIRNMREAMPNARGPQVENNFHQQAFHRPNNAFQGGDYGTYSDEDDRSRRR